MDLKETDILGKNITSHWYYRSKAKAMAQLLEEIDSTTVLDVGAGSGFFSRYLLANSTARESWCIDISYDQEFDAEEAGKAVHFRKSIDSIDANLVLLMDVLEHVDDDVGLLRDYAAKVPKGAAFLISVPAFQFLWSGHDVFLEHKRRYTLNQIENVAQRAGLSVTQGVYYFGATFPLAAALRIIDNLFSKADRHRPRSQLKPHHPAVNELLASLSHAELLMMNHNRLAGLTAFCLAKKS